MVKGNLQQCQRQITMNPRLERNLDLKVQIKPQAQGVLPSLLATTASHGASHAANQATSGITNGAEGVTDSVDRVADDVAYCVGGETASEGTAATLAGFTGSLSSRCGRGDFALGAGIGTDGGFGLGIGHVYSVVL